MIWLPSLDYNREGTGSSSCCCFLFVFKQKRCYSPYSIPSHGEQLQQSPSPNQKPRVSLDLLSCLLPVPSVHCMPEFLLSHPAARPASAFTARPFSRANLCGRPICPSFPPRRSQRSFQGQCDCVTLVFETPQCLFTASRM